MGGVCPAPTPRPPSGAKLLKGALAPRVTACLLINLQGPEGPLLKYKGGCPRVFSYEKISTWVYFACSPEWSVENFAPTCHLTRLDLPYQSAFRLVAAS